MDFLYVTGGTLAPDAPSYVERGADRDLLAHLESGETCYVLNSRQMGKSSLCVRTIGKLQEQGVRTVFCDLTKFGGRNLTAEQWYAALLSEMGRDLGLRGEFLAYWKEHAELPPVQRLFGALVEVGLKEGSQVVVFIDEIDVTLSLPFSADEFFAAIRQCYVGRATDERLMRLSFCLLGTATPADLIQDTRVSPFNIGKRVELRDFTAEEAAPLAAGLGQAVLLNRVLHWTGGHPYLTQRLCQAVMDSESKDVDRVCSGLFLTHAAKDGDDNLAFVRNRLLKSEADLAALLDLYNKMRSGKSVQDDETNPLCALLKLSGVAKVEQGHLRVRNRIYEHVFDRDWVETHMPDAEKRRQKEAYRKGLFRATSFAAAVGVVFVILIILVVQRGNDAKHLAEKYNAARKNSELLLYFAQIQLAYQEFENRNFERVKELLRETQQSPERGFEWRYLASQCQPRGQVLRGHKGGTGPIVYSADGRKLASGSFDATIVVWDVQTGAILKKLVGHKDPVMGLAFGPDGESLASSSQDSTVRIWDLRSGRGRIVYEVPGKSILSVAFARQDGSLFCTVEDGRALRLDVPTGEVLTTYLGHTDWCWSVAVSPDGKTIATGGLDHTARLWDSSTGKCRKVLRGHLGEVWFAKFSPDGKRLVTGSSDKTAIVWDLLTGNQIHVLRGHSNTAGGVDYSRDGKYIATGSWDHTAKLWDAASGNEIETIIGHSDSVNSVAFSPDSRQVATSSGDKSVMMFPIAGRRPPGPRLAQGYRWSVPSASGKCSAVALYGRTVIVHHWDTGVTLTLPHDGRVEDLRFSRDERLLVTASQDRSVRVWEVRTGKLFHRFVANGPITSAVLSSDGRFVACSVRTGDAYVWDVQTRATVCHLKPKHGEMFGVAFSPDGGRMATGGGDGIARVWSVANGQLLQTLPGHSDAIIALTFSPDGLILATGSEDNSVRVWDTRSTQTLCKLRGFAGGVWALLFSPDGKRIATNSGDGRVRLWDPESGNMTGKFEVREAYGLAFSDDSEHLYATELQVGNEMSIRSWDAPLSSVLPPEVSE